MTLFGHPLGGRPPYEGPATEAQKTALRNVCQGFGQVDGETAVQVIKDALGVQELDRADASRLIDWAKTAPDSAWKAVVHRASERMGQGVLM